MNKICTMLRIGAFCVAGSFATAGGATVISFDSVSNGTTLTNEYVGVGAVFSGEFVVSNNTYGGVLAVPSPPQYIALGLTFSTLRFIVPGNLAQTATTNSVSVTVPSLTQFGGCYGGFQMDAYDSNDSLIGTLPVPGVGSEGSAQKTYTLNAPGIARVDFGSFQQACVVPFDNLTFDLNRPEVGVPALEPRSLALLALLLALGSFAVLRRRN